MCKVLPAIITLVLPAIIASRLRKLYDDRTVLNSMISVVYSNLLKN